MFLLGAVAAGLIEPGIWHFEITIVWGVVLVALSVAFMIEWRTVGPSRH